MAYWKGNHVESLSKDQLKELSEKEIKSEEVKKPKKKLTKTEYLEDNVDEVTDTLHTYYSELITTGAEHNRNLPTKKTIREVLTTAWDIQRGKCDRWIRMVDDERRDNRRQYDEDVHYDFFEDHGERPKLNKDDIPWGYKGKSPVQISLSFFKDDERTSMIRKRRDENPYKQYDGISYEVKIKFDDREHTVMCTVNKDDFSQLSLMLDRTFGSGMYSIVSMFKSEHSPRNSGRSTFLNQYIYDLNGYNDTTKDKIYKDNMEIEELKAEISIVTEEVDMLKGTLRDEHERISKLIEEILNDTKNIYELRKVVDGMALCDNDDVKLDLEPLLELTNVNPLSQETPFNIF